MCNDSYEAMTFVLYLLLHTLNPFNNNILLTFHCVYVSS